MQAKSYWSILKTFCSDKKIPIISPLLIDDKFATDIQTKANIFNKFFADQCTLLKNGSVLPTSQMLLTSSRLCTLTLKRLGGGQFDPPCGFSKNVSSKERVKPWFFVTFNIISKHIFLENFIEFPQVV